MIRSRKAGIDDIALIRDLAEKSFLPTYKEILSADQLDWMFDWMYSADSLRRQIEDGHVFFIAYDGDRPCGYVSVERQGEALFHLQKIYVLPDFQGKHVGRYLVRLVFDYVKSLYSGECTVELNVNRNNKAKFFYERMGFSVARSGDFSIGNGYYMNDYIMAIELS
ncbi:MAG: GNAT family N-acetyltransferase [Tannerella sp.]|uniref:GNAT family N-acetyltransferase n=1 Tax=uncultured Coprobacter sp. TaxID=1720550 RepID=UPI002623A2F1|nr:GNAT family N-acetyltransferase [uncultured Coprobacter sp.]MBS6269332.1 GNAT family N-acetyltransferase [Tannerella sp.]